MEVLVDHLPFFGLENPHFLVKISEVELPTSLPCLSCALLLVGISKDVIHLSHGIPNLLVRVLLKDLPIICLHDLVDHLIVSHGIASVLPGGDGIWWSPCLESSGTELPWVVGLLLALHGVLSCKGLRLCR